MTLRFWVHNVWLGTSVGLNHAPAATLLRILTTDVVRRSVGTYEFCLPKRSLSAVAKGPAVRIERWLRSGFGALVAGAAITVAGAQEFDWIDGAAAPLTVADTRRALRTGVFDSRGGEIAGGTLCALPLANCQAPNGQNALNSTRPGFRVAEDFDVSANGTISGLCWSGVYSSGGADCSSTAMDAFTVKFYDDNGGVPGALRGTFTQGSTLTVARGSSGRELGASGLDIIEYTATLAGPAVLATNCYWLEITNAVTACTWYWETGMGPGAFAVAAQDDNAAYGINDVVPGNLAFCVSVAIEDASGQPCAPNAPLIDDCAQAQMLAIGIPALADLRSSTSNPADPPFGCLVGGSGVGHDSVWFQFVATATQHRISTCDSAAVDSVLAVYSGSCGSLVEIGCNDDACGSRSELCVEDLTPGAEYLVQLAAAHEAARGVYTLTISECLSCQRHSLEGVYIVTPSITGVTAAYDDFRTAEAGSVSMMTFQSTWWNGLMGASARAAEPLPENELFTLRIFQQGPGGLPGTLVGVRSVAAGDLSLASRSDTGVYFEYNGVGGFQDGADASVFDYAIEFAPITLSGGACYWITIQNGGTGADGAARFRWLGGPRFVMTAGNDRRAHDISNNGVDPADIRTGDYVWCLDLALGDSMVCRDTTPPANDVCSNATVVPCDSAGIELTANLQNATTSANDPFPSCLTSAPVGTVWYQLTTGATPASFLVQTCPSTFAGLNDTVLAVYAAGPSGCAGVLTEVACANDYCGSGLTFEELRIDPALPDTTYFVLLGAPDSLSQVSYRIRFTCPAPPPPANDLCADAAPLDIGVPTQGTTLDSTLDANAVDAGGCNQVTVTSKGVWHTVVGNGRMLEANLCTLTQFDTLVSVYCESCEGPACVTADDDGCGPVGGASRVQWCAKNNAVYRILVHNYPGEFGGPYEIVVNDIGRGECVPAPDCTVEPCPGEIGDLNCDGEVTFFDIDPFLLAQFNLEQYRSLYCAGSICTADINCSGQVDFFDIDPFLACLFTTCPPCAP